MVNNCYHSESMRYYHYILYITYYILHAVNVFYNRLLVILHQAWQTPSVLTHPLRAAGDQA